MKQFNRKELLLRIVASSAEAIIFYIGYMFINQIIGSGRVNILFFVIAALFGLLANLLPYNSSDKRKQSLMFSTIGFTVAVSVTAAAAIKGFNLLSLPIIFGALVLIYFRSNTSYLSNILYIFNIGDFNRNIGLLFIINTIAAYFPHIYNSVSGEMMRYAVLYIIMGLYMLAEIKNFRYVSKSENNKKSPFDIIGTGVIIFLTVIMSISKVFAVFIKPFTVVFGFVYGLVTKLMILISYPFGIGLNAIYDMFHLPDQFEAYEKIFTEMDPLKDKAYEGLTDNSNPYFIDLVQLIGKVLTFLVLLAICVYLVYILFRFIDRFGRSKSMEDFEEDKEFILGNRASKRPGLVRRLAESVKKAANEIAFMLTADNADKLRSEYKDFIKKLHSKKIIEHYNYTTLDILDIALQKAPSHKPILESITNMYEEVRYGVKYPEDSELKTFRRNINEIEKIIM